MTLEKQDNDNFKETKIIPKAMVEQRLANVNKQLTALNAAKKELETALSLLNE